VQGAPTLLNTGKKIHSNDSEDDAEANHTFMENGILVEKKAKQEIEAEKEGDAASGKKASPSKSSRVRKNKWIPHNIAEYFFFNDNGQLEISEESIRNTYSAYTTILSNAHKQLRTNYEELAAAAFGSHNPDAPLPLCMPEMKTNPMQHYLDEDILQRLGFENEVFESGRFSMINENNADGESSNPATTSATDSASSSKEKETEEEESKGGELERG